MQSVWCLLFAIAAVSAADIPAISVTSPTPLDKADVLHLALLHRTNKRSVTKPVFVIESGISSSPIEFRVEHVVDVGGWGVVVIGESQTGESAYLTASNLSASTHLSVRNGRLNQKLHAWHSTLRSLSPVTSTSELPDEASPVVFGGLARRGGEVCATERNGRVVIRVGVLHTPDVLRLPYYGGNSDAVRAEVAVAVAEANAVVFPLSGINIEIELCVNDLIPSPSVERSTSSTTLMVFSNSERVEQIRTDNKCDTMVLFATLGALGGNACGIGQLPGRHAVVAADCFGPNYSFLHEFGHNMGACHGPPNWSCGSAANGYGDAPHGFRTILAYRSICGSNDCVRIPRFSNKDTTFSWNGYAIGDGSSNNAKVINDNRDTLTRGTC